MTQVEESSKEQFGLSELTLTQMNYLETINQLENPNITELATALKLTKPTVKVSIDKLITRLNSGIRNDNERRRTLSCYNFSLIYSIFRFISIFFSLCYSLFHVLLFVRFFQ